VRERWEGKVPFAPLPRSGRLCACPQSHTGLNAAAASGNDWVKLVTGESLKMLTGKQQILFRSQEMAICTSRHTTAWKQECRYIAFVWTIQDRDVHRTNPPWEKVTSGPECRCGHTPQLTSPKNRASQWSCQCGLHARGLQWWLAKYSSEVTSLLRSKLPKHSGMLTASGIFLLLMNISLSYGREKEVSKPTCKCLKAFGFFTIMFIILEIT